MIELFFAGLTWLYDLATAAIGKVLKSKFGAWFAGMIDKAGVPKLRGTSRTLTLRQHLGLLKSKLRQSSGDIICNDWAFSTHFGVQVYETSVQGLDVKRLEFEEVLSELLQETKSLMQSDLVAGVIFYGHGNMEREIQLFNEIDKSGLKLRAQAGFVDYSPIYHALSVSIFNPLGPYGRQISESLFADFTRIDDPSHGRRILGMREKFSLPGGVVFHVFLGNTFGNIETNVLCSMLDTYTRPNDIILAEYAVYPNVFFDDFDVDDGVATMARGAVSELFGQDKKLIQMRYEADYTQKMKWLETSLMVDDQPLVFRSMLRRNFDVSELSVEEYQRPDTPQQHVSIRDLQIAYLVARRRKLG